MEVDQEADAHPGQGERVEDLRLAEEKIEDLEKVEGKTEDLEKAEEKTEDFEKAEMFEDLEKAGEMVAGDSGGCSR